MPSIAALLTCFNRKALTLQCLQQLLAQQGLGTHFRLQIFLVDDGCTDGTAEAVKQAFPEVTVIAGNGQLYWNGGMRLAWQTAVTGNYDFYLWVNDDSFLYADAIQRLLSDYAGLLSRQEQPGAIAGTMIDPETGIATYGGQSIQSALNHLQLALVQPENQPQRCDFINGNIALVPAIAVDSIGILDPFYKHGYGDYDYSWRLQKFGFSCWIGGGIFGQCSIDKRNYTLSKHSTLKERLENIRNMERLYPYQDQMYFVRHCSGRFWPIWWLKAWLRGQFPLLWLLLTRY